MQIRFGGRIKHLSLQQLTLIIRDRTEKYKQNLQRYTFLSIIHIVEDV